MDKKKGGEAKQETTCNLCISRGVYAIKHTGFGTQTDPHLTSPRQKTKKPFNISHLIPAEINTVSKNQPPKKREEEVCPAM